MRFKKLVVLAAMVLGSSSALAGESYFDFSFNSVAGYSGSLVLGGTSIGAGEFLINSVTGTVNGGQSVTLLTGTAIGSFNGATVYQAPALNGISYDYDQVLYTSPGSQPFDVYGLGLTTTTSNSLNIYSPAATTLFYVDNGRLLSFGNTSAALVPINATITAAVPEPGTYAMLLAGLAAIGFVTWRRQRPAMPFAA